MIRVQLPTKLTREQIVKIRSVRQILTTSTTVAVADPMVTLALLHALEDMHARLGGPCRS